MLLCVNYHVHNLEQAFGTLYIYSLEIKNDTEVISLKQGMPANDQLTGKYK